METADNIDMSENEKYEAQGRAYAMAKQLRSEISTAMAELKRCSRPLSSLVERIGTVAADPKQALEGDPARGAQLVHELKFDPPDLKKLADLIDAVYTKTRDLKELEEQIKEF